MRYPFLLMLLVTALEFKVAAGLTVRDSLSKLLRVEKVDSLKSRLLYKISWEYILENDNNKALDYAQRSLKFAELSNFKFGKAVACQYIGTALQGLSDHKNAILYYHRSLILWKELKDDIGVADIHIGLCNVYYSISNYEEALGNAAAGLKTASAINDQNRSASCYQMIGIIYYDKGEFLKSFTALDSALIINEKINNLKGLADIYNNIGNVLSAQKNYSEALKKYYKALELRKKLNDKIGIAVSYNNIGVVFFCKKQFAQALDKYSSALRIYKDENYTTGIADALTNIGNCYQNLKSFNKALENYKQSLEARQMINDQKGIAVCYKNMASVMILEKQLMKARMYLEKALTISKKINDKETLKDIYSDFVIADTLQLDYKSATHDLLMFQHYKDSIYNFDAAKLINDLNLKYETEKKDNEIILLNKDKSLQELELQNQKIKSGQKNIFIVSSIVILLIILIFSYLLLKRYKTVKNQKEIIELKEIETTRQKELIQEKQEEILDSIHYAKRIQTALLANKNTIDETLTKNFIHFNPKDIVSGDFYWATLHHNKFYLAICDSTGHGVPGAFMSLLNMGFLSEAVKEKNIERPNEIFNYVRTRLIETVSSEGQKDGMDGILLCYNKTTQTYTYAAANNEPILIRNNNIIELPKDKMPVGKGEKSSEFTHFELDVEPGDRLYLYTDGFADQFGGPKGKKFKYKQLNELLQNLALLPMSEQRNALERTFNEWKGNLEQVDDVLIAGIKI